MIKLGFRKKKLVSTMEDTLVAEKELGNDVSEVRGNGHRKYSQMFRSTA